MLALRRGYYGVGLEIGKADVKEAADYMTRYLEFHRIKYKRTDSALTVRGQVGGRGKQIRVFRFGGAFKAGDTRTLRLICGDTRGRRRRCSAEQRSSDGNGRALRRARRARRAGRIPSAARLRRRFRDGTACSSPAACWPSASTRMSPSATR